ncbi:UvrD-helicase domain-containing protein [Micromonospora sp. MA102]|uniref:UvrD-helicase domain-containing protein n=1 Tax=Micromonospora sp. MA102 TaxID=2952755 RepID=UPI0021C960F1|nr:ATP-dependent helicase [Micromonospora sp. MA102]
MTPAEWTPSPGIELETNADIACRITDRSIAVTAGPGTGKSELLAQRASFLLETGQCPLPKRILAISFKVDAAANLRHRVRLRVRRELARRFDSYTFHAFSMTLIRRFRLALSGINALDPEFTVGPDRIKHKQITYNDFLPLANEVLDNSEAVLRALRETYSHVFLDEFQDCTNNQYSLITKAFMGTPIQLTAVGDTKQRIMVWAGALEGIFNTFASDFAAMPLNLYQNRRSAPRLRRLQNRMVIDMDPIAAVPEGSIEGEEGTIDLLGFDTAEDEAVHLAEWIQQRISTGIPASRIAVLFAKQSDLYCQPLHTQLDRAGVPYRNDQQLQDLLAEPFSKVLLAFLKLATSNQNAAAYESINASGLLEGEDEERTFRRHHAWNEHLKAARALALQRIADPEVIGELVSGLVSMIGPSVLATLSSLYDEARLSQLSTELTRRLRETMFLSGGDLAATVERLGEDGGVKIMTIHKSKGLEFEAVVIPAVEKEMFWGDYEDERANYFVAVSRAKHHLLLTCANHRSKPKGAPWNWSTTRSPYFSLLAYAQGLEGGWPSE